MLPNVPVVPRVEEFLLASPQRGSPTFPIGSAPHTPQLPDAWYQRGNAELAKRNRVSIEKRPDEERTQPKIDVVLSPVPLEMAGSGGIPAAELGL